MRFILFGCIWEHFLPYNTQCKTGQLVQKFVPRSRVRIFLNERTRFSHLDPKQTFWCVSYYLGAIGTVWLPYETRCKTGRTSAKRAELVQKFIPRSRVRIFCYERTRFSHLDPKLMFWCVSYDLGAIGTVWMPYETRCKTGRTSAKVRVTKSPRNFSQRMHPIHPIRP